jgi:integrase
MSPRLANSAGPCSKMLLSDFIEYFVNLSKHDLRSSTLTHVYDPAFKSFLRIAGNKQLSAYTVLNVELYRADRLNEWSPVTYNICFRALKAAFNRALKWDLIKENPFLKSKQVRVPEKPPVHFSREEFDKFIALVKEPVLRDLFFFGVMTGMRQGEMLNLRWCNVDLDRKLIRISSQDGFVTKTGRSRIIPLNDDALELLDRLRTAGKGTYVFAQRGEPLKPSYATHSFKRYVRAADLRDDLKFHSLRHTFATWLLQCGATIYEIQKLLGHYDIKTTQIYAHLSASELHSTVNKISFHSCSKAQIQEPSPAAKSLSIPII